MSIQLHETRIGIETLDAIRRFCISYTRKRLVKTVHRDELESFSLEHEVLSIVPNPDDPNWFIVLFKEGR